MQLEHWVRGGVRAAAGMLALALMAGVAFAACGEAPASADPASNSSSWQEPEEDQNYDADAGKIDTELYKGTVLPATEDAGQEYLDETLFIGDSNTVRYMMYGEDDKTPFTSLQNNIGVTSMGAGAITSLKCEEFEGYAEPVTIPEAVKIMQPRRIIICFGTNDLTGANNGTKAFIDSYKKGLAAIHKAYPYADIIVSAIPPLDKQRQNTSLSMSQVDAYNQALVKMCEDEGYKFLDSSEALKDEKTGWAKTDYTLSDGVHLSKKGVTAYFEYVRTHAYLTEDARPKPLKKVPKAKGTPPGLISEDPIAVRGQKENLVPVEFLAGEGGRVEGELNQSVEKGKQCTAVKAVPEEGWAFDYWTIEPVGTAGDAKEELVFTVPGDADANGVVIQAHFKPVATPAPSASPSPTPSASPSATPQPTGDPTPQPTGLPTAGPTAEPTLQPTEAPTEAPHTHTWGPEETLSPASCTAPGRAKHTCACGASEEYESGAALGHDFSQNGPTCSRCTEPNPNYSAGSQPTAPPAESNGEQGGGAGGGA